MLSLINPRFAYAVIAGGLIVVGAIGFGPTTALATTGITTSDTTINFQGRLLTAAGAVVPDGTYNMQFKIYKNGDGTATGDTGGVGGTLLWTEQWIQDTAGLGAGNTSGVVVKNGYFSVNLGTYCSLAGSTCQGNTNTGTTFNESVMWLSMNVAGGVGATSTTCTPFSSCANGELEMVPMNALESAPYAENAGELGGLTSGGYIQNVAPNATQQTANINILSGAATTVAAAEIQTVASATAPVLILKGGATPGAGADLLDLQSSTSGVLDKFDSNGDLTLTPGVIASVAGAGTAAGAVLTVTGTAGGATSGITSQVGGVGSTVSIATGAGGAATGASGTETGGAGGALAVTTGAGGAATSGVGGAGGNLTVTAGSGGASSGTNVNANGGSITLTAGAPGTGGSGTAGTPGGVLVKAPAGGDSADAFQVQSSANATNELAVDTLDSKVDIGSQTICTAATPGELCLARNVASGTGGTSLTSGNSIAQIQSGTSNGTTIIGQNYTLSDLSTATGNALQGIVINDTSSTNANSIAFTGIQVNGRSTDTGSLLQLQGSGTNVLTVSATGATNIDTGTNTGAVGIGNSSAGSVTIASGAASSFTTAAGLLTLQGAGGVTINSPNVAGASGAILLESGNSSGGTAANVTLDTGTTSTGTPTVDIGNTNAKAVQIGNNTSNPAINLDSGTGTIAIGSGAQARTVTLGTGAAAEAVTVGSTTTTSGLTLQGGNSSSAVLLTTGIGGTVAVTGSQPGVSAGVGTGASGVLTVTGAAGGNTTSSSAQTAGAGGAVTLQGGAGGAATGTSGIGGVGAAVSLTSGAGGVTVGGGNANSNGGTIGLQGGAAGTGGGGAAGHIGYVALQASGGNVGIGTATPSKVLDLETNNAVVNATQFLINQNGTGDASLQVQTPAQTYYLGAASASSSNFEISSGTSDQTTSQLGYQTPGATAENSTTGFQVCSKVTAGANALISSMSAYVTNVDAAPNNLFQVAIYSDSSGPANRIATSASGTLSPANGWNTVAISASITSGTSYWLCYQKNASASNLSEIMHDTLLNDGAFNTAGGLGFGAWGATFPASTSTSSEYSLYANYTVSGAYNSFTTPIFSLSSFGQATFENSTNSNNAFQIQSANGTDLLSADTTNMAVNVGATGSVAAASTVNIGNSTSGGVAQTVNIGATTSGSRLTLQGGTGTGGASLLTGSSAAVATGALALSTGAETGSSLSSGAITILTGNAGGGTNTSSGSLTLDTGTKNGTGTVGAIDIGNTNATSLLFGNVTNTTSVLFKEAASTTALQVDNASSNSVVTVDTSSNSGQGQVILGKPSTNNGALVLDNSTNGNALSLISGATAGNDTITLPTAGATGAQCLQSNSGSSASATTLLFGSCSAGSSLQGAYNTSAGASPSIDETSANKGVTIQNDNTSPITGELFGVHAATGSGLGAGLFTVSNTGATDINTATDSTNAFEIQGANNEVDLIANTTTPNIINNDSFENGDTGWAAGPGTFSNTITLNTTATDSYNGNNSLTVNVGTHVGGGAEITSAAGGFTAFTAGTYTISFEAMNASATTGSVGFIYFDSSGFETGPSCSPTTSEGTGEFTFMSCTVVTTGTTNEIDFATVEAANFTFYLDDVQVVAGTTTGTYQPASIQLPGLITSPLEIQPLSRSGQELQVQTPAGVNVLSVSSGSGGTTSPLVVIGVGSAIDTTPTLLELDSSESDPSTEAQGAMYYNISSGEFRCGGSVGWHSCSPNLGYAATAVVTDVSSAGVTTLGSYLADAPEMDVGRVYRIEARGIYGTAAAAPTLTISITIGGTTVLANATTSTIASASAQAWSLDAYITVDSTGATGKVYADGMFQMVSGSTTLNVRPMTTGQTTINTTTNNTIAVTAQWGTSSASNTLTAQQVTIEGLGG